jgi:hypothetical protein
MDSRNAHTAYSAKLLGIHYALWMALHKSSLLIQAPRQIGSQTNVLGNTRRQALLLYEGLLRATNALMVQLEDW